MSDRSYEQWREAARLRAKRQPIALPTQHYPALESYVCMAFGVPPGTFTEKHLGDIEEAIRQAAFQPPQPVDDDIVEVLIAVSPVVAKQLTANGWVFQGIIKLLPPISSGDPYRLQFDGAVYGS